MFDPVVSLEFRHWADCQAPLVATCRFVIRIYSEFDANGAHSSMVQFPKILPALFSYMPAFRPICIYTRL
jgi:hypothetical protein